MIEMTPMIAVDDKSFDDFAAEAAIVFLLCSR
jgi:hypothetical protein